MLLKNPNIGNDNINFGNIDDEKKEKEDKDRIFLEMYSPYVNVVENTNHIKEDEENQILCHSKFFCMF